MPHALAAADLVVSRAGMGTMTELSVLLKPAIIIPMLGTHQEENAEFFARHGAVVVLSQNKLTPEAFVREIKNLLEDKEQQEELKKNIKELMKPGAAEAIADLVFLS
jgi:UDP-N-acetylglucosamine--N-acetylmuramyl-(pentapeptide) pyrophosphoryl-undecaprenol N-acetylglucosamine transferase